jgi:hypothetical protein
MAMSTAGRSNASRASGSLFLISGMTAKASSSRAGPRSNGRETLAARKRFFSAATFSSPFGSRIAQAHALGPCTSTPFASAIPPRRSFSSGIALRA